MRSTRLVSFSGVKRFGLVVLATASVLTGPLATADGRGVTDTSPGWAGEFPPEDYNPYLPESRRPVQQLFSPLQPPLYSRPPVASRPVAPLPVSPVLPRPGYYGPGMAPYPPSLYTPDPGLYPGYLYPFNNGQFFAPFF